MIYRRVLMFVGMGLSLSGSAFADLRVLFTFDTLGVKAHQVVQLADLGENYPTSVAELPVLSQDNVVMMKWVDSNGQLLALTQIPDPRVTSSPGHVNPSSASRVGLTEGAWVGDGPDGTEMVTVEFPESVALGLSQETWSVSLRQNN